MIKWLIDSSHHVENTPTSLDQKTIVIPTSNGRRIAKVGRTTGWHADVANADVAGGVHTQVV